MSPTKQPPIKPLYRADIDGLRAFAVLVVVAFHAFPEFVGGGFIGVDVFFVISGFLISTIVFQGLRYGSFDFKTFYIRRIRRIFPAVILMLLGVGAIGWFALLADEYRQLGAHIVGVVSFIPNFILWGETGYFTQTAKNLPLLHMWSLGIEEQFYLVWPALLWLIYRFKIYPLLAILPLLAGSFFLNVFWIESDPAAAFYAPHARAWELLSGALLAYIFLDREPGVIGNHVLANTLSFLGVVLLGIGVLALNQTDVVFARLPILPVFGAILLIVAGPNAWLNSTILSNRIAVWFGLISFPLYLWHWPLLSLARIVEGQTPHFVMRLSIVALSIVLAWLTYRFVERPIRFGKVERTKPGVLMLCMLVIGAAGFGIVQRDGVPSRLSHIEQANRQLLSQLVIPPVLLRNTACDNMFPDFGEGLCLLDRDALPNILLFGDSHALHFYDGLAGKISGQTIGMLGGGWGGIHLDALSPLRGAYVDEGLIGFQAQRKIYDIIAQTPAIKTVVIASSANIAQRQSGHAQQLADTLTHLTTLGKRVIYVFDIPMVPFDPKACLETRPLRFGSQKLDPCAFPRREFDARSKPFRDEIMAVLRRFPEASFFDPADKLCDAHYCWVQKDGQFLYRNGEANAHLSIEGSKYIGQFLVPFISAQISRP